MIIWVNGPFGAGKTTLLEELSKRLDTAMTVDPELLGFALRNGSASAPGDFQDLPIWRTLTVRTLHEIRREYDRPLLVPMTLVEPQYLDEIFGSLRMAGQEIRHFFLSLEGSTVADQDREPNHGAGCSRARRLRASVAAQPGRTEDSSAVGA
ncbi:MAG TPA: tunicamycin resistance protein [Pseudonocardiaceae bacterium]|nr:tunicamycin resistance protein [Pseudonocardiaceae bacterium]